MRSKSRQCRSTFFCMRSHATCHMSLNLCDFFFAETHTETRIWTIFLFHLLIWFFFVAPKSTRGGRKKTIFFASGILPCKLQEPKKLSTLFFMQNCVYVEYGTICVCILLRTCTHLRGCRVNDMQNCLLFCIQYSNVCVCVYSAYDWVSEWVCVHCTSFLSCSGCNYIKLNRLPCIIKVWTSSHSCAKRFFFTFAKYWNMQYI